MRACQSHSLPWWSPERSADEARAALLLRSAAQPRLLFYTGRFGNAACNRQGAVTVQLT